MKTTQSSEGIPTKNIIRVFAITAGVLLLPFAAMAMDWRVTDPGSSDRERVNWNLFDFIVMGSLLLTIGFMYEFLILKFSATKDRVILALLLLVLLFLIWAELAVGIFGSPIAGS